MIEVIEKACIRCGKTKPLSEYYKHSQMGDGHLNKCKSCTKSDSRKRYHEKIEDPAWLVKERKRGRDKYMKFKYKSSRKNKCITQKAWEEKFPEKKKATTAANYVLCPPGMQRHHWSYNKQHYKDVIFLSPQNHAKAHRFLTYDQQSKMYLSMSGTLLDTKEKHLEYIQTVINIPF